MMDKKHKKEMKKEMKAKYQGKGIRARLNTAGEKMIFGRKSSA